MSQSGMPLTAETARQQVEQLSATYETSKIFGNGSGPGTFRSEFFGPDERAQLDWIAANPQVQQMLEDYASKRAELIRLDKESVRMWGDGTQSTPEQREAYLISENARVGLNSVTANLFGAMGANIGQRYFPDDLEMQTKVAESFKMLGEMWFSTGETTNVAGENARYRPWEPGMKQYAPGKRETEDPPPPPDSEEIPVGGKTFNPYEIEGEGPDSEIPDEGGPEAPDGQNVDGGMSMGVSQDDPTTSESIGTEPQDSGGYSYQGPNQSLQEDDNSDQSIPEEPNASYPEDPASNQNGYGGPNASFPEDDEQNLSEPTEPNASFPEDSPQQSFSPDAGQSFPEDPITSQNASYEPPQSYSQTTQNSQTTPVQDPVASYSTVPESNQSLPIESAPPYSPPSPEIQSMPPDPIQSLPPEPAPVETAPIETMPSPTMSSPEPMQSVAPEYDPA
jgi:hypothetical protein